MDRVLNVSEAEIQDIWGACLGLQMDEDDPSFLSTAQVATGMGIPRETADGRLKQAVKDGRAEVRHVRRRCEDGRVRTLLVYRPVNKGGTA